MFYHTLLNCYTFIFLNSSLENETVVSDAIFALFLISVKKTGKSEDKQDLLTESWARVLKSLINTCGLTEWNVYVKVVHPEKLVEEALVEGTLCFRAVWALRERHTSKEKDASGKRHTDFEMTECCLCWLKKIQGLLIFCCLKSYPPTQRTWSIKNKYSFYKTWPNPSVSGFCQHQSRYMMATW